MKPSLHFCIDGEILPSAAAPFKLIKIQSPHYKQMGVMSKVLFVFCSSSQQDKNMLVCTVDRSYWFEASDTVL